VTSTAARLLPHEHQGKSSQAPRLIEPGSVPTGSVPKPSLARISGPDLAAAGAGPFSWPSPQT
jgi:hypothetical protein